MRAASGQAISSSNASEAARKTLQLAGRSADILRMKTLIFVFLLLALTGAAVWTKPSRGSFKAVIQQQLAADADKDAADLYMARLRYVDRFLCVTIERPNDNKVLSVGAFGRWYNTLEENQTIAGMLENAPLESMLQQVVEGS